MNTRTANILFSYAVLLLLTGLFSSFYNPDHVIGWNEKGKTGLMVCGAGAVLAAVFGFCSKKGMGWALWAGLVLSFLFVAQCGFSSFKAGRGMSAGDAKLWFKLAINVVAFLVSVRAFVYLSLISTRGEQVNADEQFKNYFEGGFIVGLVAAYPVSYFLQPGAMKLIVSLGSYVGNISEVLGNKELLSSVALSFLICPIVFGILGWCIKSPIRK